MLADQVCKDFPKTQEGKNYLDEYWASRLSEFKKSEDYKKEVALVVGPYLHFAFETCRQKFLAYGYPLAGEDAAFLNFDLVLDTVPNPFD
ncbi:UNVERIFIED_CONTAM: hypothetical protein Sangu_1460600 [Sesamum angustifolium]|uniref:Uncharacterized protein n=1 Tax=Sesamum angustifolium TaxID=2727405 RepID=A0AAW2N8W8_9LAMI